MNTGGCTRIIMVSVHCGKEGIGGEGETIKGKKGRKEGKGEIGTAIGEWLQWEKRRWVEIAGREQARKGNKRARE